MTYNLFSAISDAVFVLYTVRELGITAQVLGLILGIGGLGGLLGAGITSRAVQRLGLGRALVLAGLVLATSRLLIPLASGSSAWSVGLLVAAGFTGRFAVAILVVNLVTIQQAVTPQAMLGRVNATSGVLLAALLPIGALLGGTLGELIGIRLTLVVGALGSLLSLFWLWLSPLARLPQPDSKADSYGGLKITGN
jgi:predicted MFS family arabinose efflux permease